MRLLMIKFPKLVSRLLLCVFLQVIASPVLLHGVGVLHQNKCIKDISQSADFGEPLIAMLGFIETDAESESQENVTEHKVIDANYSIQIDPIRKCADIGVPGLSPNHSMLYKPPPR